MPDWLQALEGSGDASPPPGLEETPSAGEVSQWGDVEVPAWLEAMSEEEGEEPAPFADETPAEDAPWMEAMEGEEATAPPDEDEVPPWLQAVAAAQAAAQASPPAGGRPPEEDTLPDWLQEPAEKADPDEDRPAGGVRGDSDEPRDEATLPDWLEEAVEPPAAGEAGGRAEDEPPTGAPRLIIEPKTPREPQERPSGGGQGPMIVGVILVFLLVFGLCLGLYFVLSSAGMLPW
jgi:hypothetical protein